MYFPITLISLLLFIITSVATTRVPSLAEIQSFNNPELNNIFTTIAYTQRPPEPVFSKAGFGWSEKTREIPIERERGFDPISYPQSSHYGSRLGTDTVDYATREQVRQLAQTGAKVFATGAEAFVSGAQQVGRVFGVDSGNLFSHVGSALLGKR